MMSVYELLSLSTLCIYMSKTKILNLRIDPDLKRRAKAIAQEDGRTLSNWVTHLIEREVKKIRKEKEK